jgi:hypothetical protein
MTVRAAGVEPDGALAQSSCFALDAGEPHAVIDDKVVARVFAEGDEHRDVRHSQSKHDRECGLVSDVLRMFM